MSTETDDMIRSLTASRDELLRENRLLRETLTSVQTTHYGLSQARAVAEEHVTRLREALEKAKEFAVCNCAVDDDTGRVISHYNCQRRLMPIIESALIQPDNRWCSKDEKP